MDIQAIMTLSDDSGEVLKVAAECLTPRGCEFLCGSEQLPLFRTEQKPSGRYQQYPIKLAVYPHSGPRPQYVTAIGQVLSIRRCSQSTYRVNIVFQQLQSDGCRLIAEHISPKSTVENIQRSA